MLIDVLFYGVKFFDVIKVDFLRWLAFTVTRGELLELMRSARESGETGQTASMPERPTAEQTRRIGQLQQRVRDVAAGLGISPEVLATRRDVEGLVLGAADHYGQRVDVSQPECVHHGDPVCVIRVRTA